MFCPKADNFANTLIQDIPIFNDNDSTQLEDWLEDIEPAANLTAESRTKQPRLNQRINLHFDYNSSYLR